jgi:hypothetical protein
MGILDEVFKPCIHQNLLISASPYVSTKSPHFEQMDFHEIWYSDYSLKLTMCLISVETGRV